MVPAPIPPTEKERLEALRSYRILDTEAERDYDDLTRLASVICGTPAALITLIDSDRQWFKARIGIEDTETTRELAFCSHTILQNDVLVVEDTLKDDRFVDNPMVVHAPHIRFYAGAPLVTPGGLAIGSLCALDRIPRQLSQVQSQSLRILARQVGKLLELRLTNSKLVAQTEELANLNAFKDRLFSMLGHDLRSPFSGLVNFTEILETSWRQLPPEELEKIFGYLNESAGATLRMLNEILEWSSWETGVLKQKPESIVLEHLFATIRSELHGVWAHKNIQFEIETPQGLELVADKTMLHSVVLNLSSNALKFTKEGGRVRLSAIRTPEGLRISVEDNGVGMTAEDLGSLFDVKKAHSLRGTQGEKGSGLGLLQTKRFLDSMGVRMIPQSEPGIGTRFDLFFPIS